MQELSANYICFGISRLENQLYMGRVLNRVEPRNQCQANQPGAPGLALFETWVRDHQPRAATQNRAALFEEEVPASGWQ